VIYDALITGDLSRQTYWLGLATYYAMFHYLAWAERA
jgi:hypothetical protein